MLNNIQKSFRDKLSLGLRGAGIDGTPTPEIDGAPTTKAPTGASLRSGDWQSPNNIRPVVPPATTAPTPAAPATGLRGAMSGLAGKTRGALDAIGNSKVVKIGGGAVGVMGGTLGGVRAVGDIERRGLNLDNGSDMLTAGATLGGVVSAPLATGALAFSAGRGLGASAVEDAIPWAEKKGYLPMGMQMGVMRASDSIMHPVDTAKRVFSGGKFLADDPTKHSILGPELAGRDFSSEEIPNSRPTLRNPQTVNSGAMSGTTPSNASPTQAPAAQAPTLRQGAPLVIGKDGMATRGGNPVAGYGSMTNSSGKRINFSPDENNSVTTQPSLRNADAYAPTQYSSKYGTSGLDAQIATLDAMRDAKPKSFLNEIRGNLAAKRGLRQQEMTMTRDIAKQGNDVTMDGHAVQRENNANSLRASMYNHAATLGMTRAQMQIAQMNHNDLINQQGIENNRAQNAQDMTANAEGKTQLQSELETRNPGGDGKPDTNRIASQRAAIERSMGDLGLTHGQLNKSGLAKEQLLAGASLIDKVNSGATNWPNPFMADYMKTMKPHQLVNMKRLPNGDAQTQDYVGPDGKKMPGQIIPARFFTNKEANRLFPGTPTDEFSSLFAKENK